MKDFFISYNKADRTWAEWIAWQLEENEFTVVLQAWDFLPGSHFIHEMQKAITETQRTIAVLSPDYLSAEYTHPEWEAAFLHDPNGNKRLLIPVRVQKCEPNGLLEQIVYVDLVDKQEAEAKRLLINAVEGKGGKPSAPPIFPGTTPKVPFAPPTIISRPKFPGLPPIWNVPHLRNPNFLGRDVILNQLHETLTSGHAAALTAIHGMGGIGKTQVAVEYAFRHGSDYDFVWWIRSEEPATLAGDYAALATPLNLPQKDAKEQPLIIAAVKEYLRQNTKWLLIFDNAVDGDSIREYIPPGGGGHIVITSRDPNWKSIGTALRVEIWDRQYSKAFLLKRTDQKDDASADALAKELGDLPLALEQTGAYIEETGISIAEYLKLFKTHHLALMKKGHVSKEYSSTVATTWTLSFTKLEQESPAAADLLRLCSFWAPENIPLDLSFNDVKMAIKRYSLAELQNESMNMHRLVQAVIRDSTDEATIKELIERSADTMNFGLPDDMQSNISSWKLCNCLLPHAYSLTSFFEMIDHQTKGIGILLNQMGLYLAILAQYIRAVAFYERSLSVCLRVLEENDPLTATVNNNLGAAWLELGDTNKAIFFFEKALKIDLTVFGDEHPNVAVRYNNIGGAWHGLGDANKAIYYYEKALKIDNKAFGYEHPETARDFNNLGEAWRIHGDANKAISYIEKALAIIRKAYGDVHPHVAISYNNLGGAWSNLGNAKKAISYFEKALEIDLKIFGNEHPSTARDYLNLGSEWRALKDAKKAIFYFEKALEIDLNVFGIGHPSTAGDLNNLGSAWGDLGDANKAISYYEKAVNIDLKIFGIEHPAIARDYNNLGGAWRDLGNTDRSVSYFEKALNIFMKVFGPNHPSTKTAKANLESVSKKKR
jgi:tetratricopeptide (TPR) repeat protein